MRPIGVCIIGAILELLYRQWWGRAVCRCGWAERLKWALYAARCPSTPSQLQTDSPSSAPSPRDHISRTWSKATLRTGRRGLERTRRRGALPPQTCDPPIQLCTRNHALRHSSTCMILVAVRQNKSISWTKIIAQYRTLRHADLCHYYCVCAVPHKRPFRTVTMLVD